MWRIVLARRTAPPCHDRDDSIIVLSYTQLENGKTSLYGHGEHAQGREDARKRRAVCDDKHQHTHEVSA